MPGGLGVRIDTHIYQGLKITPFYDSLLAKLITYGKNREEAIEKMDTALAGFKIGGVNTTIPFLRKIINSSVFRNGQIYTTFLEERAVNPLD